MGLYTCPPKVRNLINLINACGDQKMDIISVNEADDFPAIGRKLLKISNKFKPIARDYIWTGSTRSRHHLEDDDPVTKIEDAVRRYDTLRRGRIIVERIVNLSRRPHEERRSITITTSAVSFDELRLTKSGKTRTINRKVIEPYQIRIIKHPSLLDALDGSMARIRQCSAKECGTFFWVGRDTNTKTECSERCSSPIRSARYRAKKKAKKGKL
jgi:hypothetical protein